MYLVCRSENHLAAVSETPRGAGRSGADWAGARGELLGLRHVNRLTRGGIGALPAGRIRPHGWPPACNRHAERGG
jgi:hypothetical protein